VYNVCTQALQWVPHAHHCVFFLSNFFIFFVFSTKNIEKSFLRNKKIYINSSNFAKRFEEEIAKFCDHQIGKNLGAHILA
jgi:hypothetical protein